jgi:hypothetical protein
MMMNKGHINGHLHSEVIGQSILLASMQAAIGSVEMSSKFSVLSFAKDQDTLQRAADALTSYLIIAAVWAIGTSMILYSEFGMIGLFYSMLTNIVIVGWIFGSYWKAFKIAACRNNLQMPKLFSSASLEDKKCM